jgi:pyruvate kinase
MTSSTRATKIVATCGPATDPDGMLDQLLLAGVNVFRLNASHGTGAERIRRIREIRKVAQTRGTHCAVLLDLQGPKIRLGKFEGGKAELRTGSRFTITTNELLGNAEIASTVYKNFARDVQPGDRVLLADGALTLRVVSTDGVAAVCDVVSGGMIGDRKGINLPGVRVSTPSLTDKDKEDLIEGLAEGIDLVALSFVRHGADVASLREFMRERRAEEIPIVAKIEKPEACDALDGIIAEADGIMVARGDLGVELALEKVPAVQKMAIEKARNAGKFIITATQMLESMIENSHPTRAEVSDVANAIYDGTDAVMLSAETSAGKFPLEAVRTMALVAEETDAEIRKSGYRAVPVTVGARPVTIIAEAAYRAARGSGASGIAVFTTSGHSARQIATFRPPVPVYAFTPSELVANQMSVIFGVRSVIAPTVKSTDKMLMQVDALLSAQAGLEGGDRVVFVAGQPIGVRGTTNLMKLHRVGELTSAEDQFA